MGRAAGILVKLKIKKGGCNPYTTTKKNKISKNTDKVLK